MRPGRELLDEWIKRSQITQREAAERFGWSGPGGEVSVSQYLAGTRRPGTDNRLDMQRVAGIPIESWSLSKVSKSNDGVLEFASKRKV